MTWQDDLQRLDERFAAKSVSAAEYRAQRDEILASASSVPAREPGPDPRAAQAPADPGPAERREAPITGASTGHQILIGAIALVVMVAAAVGLWLVVLGDDGPEPLDNPVSAKPLEAVVSIIGPLPGVPDANSGVLGLDQALDARLLAPGEADLLRAAGVQRVGFLGSTSGSTGYGVIIAELAGPSQAATTAEDQRHQLASDGYAENGAVNGLPRMTQTTDRNVVQRVVYASDRFTVRIGVSRAVGAETEGLEEELAGITNFVRSVLPPS
ncbi:hypothetical protein Actkin_00077 [Actinokineospora sp. UTMC 2448]|nr:hypothetical protein Actkin_00077 [Actinokineospora sp. UTMC 2448]